jgi:hypothetical protein
VVVWIKRLKFGNGVRQKLWLSLQVCATCKTGTNFVPLIALFAAIFVILIGYSYGTGKLLLPPFLLIHTIVLYQIKIKLHRIIFQK